MSEQRRSCKSFDIEDLSVVVDLEIAGAVQHISGTVETIMKVVRESNCGAGHEFEIEMALRESLANAIVHGCEQDPSKHVQVCVACDPQRGMIIVVRDPGVGFDPACIPSPVVGENLFSDHGRGIYLINTLMDEVTFGRNGTEIRMRKG